MEELVTNGGNDNKWRKMTLAFCESFSWNLPMIEVRDPVNEKIVNYIDPC